MSRIAATAAGAAYDAALSAYEQNDAPAAERAARETLRHDPGHTGALYMLGALQLDRGDTAAALPWLETAARNSPQHIGINRSLGIAYQAVGRASEAIPRLQFALEGGARDPALFNALGLGYHENGGREQAVWAFREALKLDPADAGTYNNLAVAYNRLHDFKAAAEAYTKSLEIAPANTEVRVNLANLYEQMNELEKAEAEVARGLELEPRSAGLKLVAARCKRREGEAQAAVDCLLPLSGDPAVPELVRRGVEFELGRNLDILQDPDRAYPHFLEGNRIAAEIWPDMVEGASGYRAELDRMLACYTPEALAALPPSAPAVRTPAFLVSFPRSGTTLMDTILGAHPGVLVMEEEPPLHYVVEELRRSRLGFPEGVLKLTPADLEELRALYWKEVEKFVGPNPEGKLVVDKNPFYSTQAPLIHRLFPGAKFIFALRHPCAVVLSCFMQPFGRNPSLANFLDLDTAALTYSKVMTLWQRYRAALPLEVHELRYESLVADKEREVKAQVEFLGLAWSQDILDHAAQAKKRGRIYTPSYHQVVRPIYTDAVNRWRNYADRFGTAIETLKPFIAEFGYQD